MRYAVLLALLAGLLMGCNKTRAVARYQQRCQNVLQVVRTSLDSTPVRTRFPACELTPRRVR